MHSKSLFLTVCLTLASIISNHAMGEDSHQTNSSSHKTTSSLFTERSLTGIPLTAKEVLQGGWIPDPNGTCDSMKGCAYKNQLEEVRYLSSSEKKLLETELKKKGNDKSTESSDEKGKIKELKKDEDWDKAFSDNSDKKAIVMIFSANNCAPCKTLKSQLQNSNFPELGLFTATRPDYSFISGHDLHSRFKNSLNKGVPTAFIYTKDSQGKWVGKVVVGAPNITSELEKVRN